MSKLENSRWTMIRDLIAFQIKLAFDALRDLLLSPVSFVCAFLDIVKGNTQENSYFHRLMNLGKQTDVWLNLFGQHTHEKIEQQANSTNEDEVTSKDGSSNNADHLIAKIEALVVEQHANGKFSTNAKAKLSQYLNKLNSKNLEPKETEPTQK